MLRLFCNALRLKSSTIIKDITKSNMLQVGIHERFAKFNNFNNVNLPSISHFSSLCASSWSETPLNVNRMSTPCQDVPVRSLTKYTLSKGKRKTVPTILRRFYRLDWGIWIRTRAGRHRKIFKRSLDNQRRMRQHVFCNSTQSWLLDTMVTKYWRKPKFYVDDPYEPYHKREEFFITQKKPKPNY